MPCSLTQNTPCTLFNPVFPHTTPRQPARTAFMAVLCAAAGYHSIAQRYFEEKGFKHVALLTADGALEAAPAMGCADIILDLVSTGGTDSSRAIGIIDS